MIELFRPYLNKDKIINDLEKLFDGKTIGEGPKVKEFEDTLADYLGQINLAMASFKVNTVALNSGTSALHLAYILAGIQKGDEVITPVLTCIATNHPILWLGAKPIFADIQSDTLNVDPDSIESKITPKTRAIVVVHNGGVPCDMDTIMGIAQKHNLKVIEDCAQALGGTYNGQKLGTIGDYGVFSFQAIKHITTGDGGMLVCKDEEDANRAKRLRWYAIDRDLRRDRDTLIPDKFNPFYQRAMTFDVDEMGYKYQMTDIEATIGLANFVNLDEILSTRKYYTELYRKELEGLLGITLLKDVRGNACWLFQILVEKRKDFQEFMAEKSIETNMVQCRNDFYKIFGGEKQDLPNMNSIEDNYVSIPVHSGLTEEQIYEVIESIKEYAQT